MAITVAGIPLSGAKVLVIGLARSGLAAIRLLARQGAIVTATDTQPLEQIPAAQPLLAELGVKFVLQSADVAVGFDLIVISPGVPADAEPLTRARAAGTNVTGELELASYFLQGPSIVITGSNGKTTTTSLIGHILKSAAMPVQVGGNIGTPPTAMIDASRPNQWNVLEASSFQLETIEHFRARIGVCLNLTPDHLDRHHTMAAYETAKGRLFVTQDESCFAVLNADDPACLRYAAQTRARPLWFSTKRPVTPGLWFENSQLLFDGQLLMDAAGIPLRGMHNVENVLAAAGAARLAGVSLEAIAAAVRTFPGVEHRLEFVRNRRGVDYFNDSKATNVDATLKALEAFERGLWIILGGKDKGSDYTPLRDPLRAKSRAALLVGAAAPKIERQIEGAVNLVRSGTIAQAIAYAAERAQPGDTVLLAPACASFDQFDNFEHRGQVFKQLVEALES